MGGILGAVYETYKFHLMAGAVAVVGFLGFVGYDEYSKATEYEQVAAIVEKVKSSCYLEKTTHYGVGKRRQKTKSGPCKIARKAAKSDPRFEGFTVIDQSRLVVRYRDSSGNPHKGNIRLPYALREKNVQPGQQVAILMHKENPDKIRSGSGLD